MPKVVVIGSSNTDMVVKTSRFPEPGETIIGGDFFMFPGGKGANQAVAAARLGGEVTFICSVGDDLFGEKALKGYHDEGMNMQGAIVTSESPSGVALITVNDEGENEIVVASGANMALSAEHIEEQSGLLENAAIVLTQLETPLSVVKYLAGYCKDKGLRLMINPAPARKLPEEVLENLFLITPNQSESFLLTGVKVNDENSAHAAAEKLLEKGVQNVIITMGSLGAFFMNRENHFMVPAKRVIAIDTTAAGDVFNGALAVSLAENISWKEAIVWATKASAIAVTRLGAQNAAPYKDEIN